MSERLIGTAENDKGRWCFKARQNDFQQQADLWLSPELDGSSVVDDSDLDGDEQLATYVRYLKQRHPEWIEHDAVPVHWGVYGGGEATSVAEFAPFSHLWDSAISEDFLTHFTWPYDPTTGEKLDWFQLPVRMDRFPEFAKALAWTPSPFQSHCPLRSILESRQAHVNSEARQHLRNLA